MKASTSISYALLLSISLSFLHSATAALTPLLVQTCKRTSDYALCIESLSGDPRTADARYVSTLADIELYNVYDKTQATLDIVGPLLQKATDPNLVHSYGVCVGAFQEIAGDRWSGAIKALESGDYAGAEGQLGGIKSNVEWCLGEFGGEPQPFSEAARLVGRLADVDIGIIKLLH
ncbi:unnamed protein product [Linum tenue]|uniref:Pectinesterase inhibitor domain-containing protein n=1 Tax=Linum tenue TaxID=586396 RepID=A0AAV0P9A6_9ROSI|nr:unnamed protein product [Linum tenue]